MAENEKLIASMAAAIYREYENRPVYAQGQMNVILANELAEAALSTLLETHTPLPKMTLENALKGNDTPR